VKLVSGSFVNATTSDTAIPVGIVVSGAGTADSPTVAVAGTATCQADSAGVTQGHFVVNSPTTGGRCGDAGATAPSSGWVIGTADTGAAANATFTVLIWPGFNAAAGGASGVSSFGPSGSPRTGAVVAGTGDYTCAQVTNCFAKNAMFAAFANASDTTDKLSSSGANQPFAMNSGVNFPASALTTGREFLLRFKVDQTVSSTNSSASFNSALCTGAGTGCVALTDYLTATLCFASGVCNWEIVVDCIVSTPGTLSCGAGSNGFWNASNGQVRGNQLSGIVTGIATTGSLYPNVLYNQTTQAGNSASLIGASGYFPN
jgi:hypothetical protein